MLYSVSRSRAGRKFDRRQRLLRVWLKTAIGHEFEGINTIGAQVSNVNLKNSISQRYQTFTKTTRLARCLDEETRMCVRTFLTLRHSVGVMLELHEVERCERTVAADLVCVH